MPKKLVFGVLAVLLPSYCYSDGIAPYYGVTNNAAADALRWSMGNVLPTPPGVTVDNVFYSYTPNKATADAMKVHIGNQSAFDESKWIWRETDDWTGIQGGIEIRKLVNVPELPKAAWGDGSIEVEGTGTITNPRVIYSYTVDPCFDPQYSPQCPGYKVQVPDIPEVDLSSIYDATSDANQEEYDILDERNENDEEEETEEEKAEREAEEEKDSKERLEKALAAADNSAMFAQAVAAGQVLDAMNARVPVNSYLEKKIAGGTYNETTRLIDTQLPENRKGLRNGLAQQLLHQKMVEMQFQTK
jgi:hypothetical protein